MATEIERKFLVSGTGWQALSTGSQRIRQAYLARSDAVIIRIRIIDDHLAFLTTKSATYGAVRSEFEYAIPLSDGEDLIKLCSGLILEKSRHIVPIGQLVWTVDEFEGPYRGLVIAEVELPNVNIRFDRPDWLGTEVTGNARFYNAELARGTNPVGSVVAGA